MRKRIYLTLCLTAIIATLLTSTLTLYAFYGVFTRETEAQLRTEGKLLAQTLSYSGENDQAYLNSLSKQVKSDLRITLVKADGTVFFDSSVDYKTMANHADRPEIAAAMQSGSGENVHFSQTLGRDTYYYAIRLADGNVLRVARQLASISASFWDMLPLIIGIIALILIVSFIIASALTKKLIRPLEKVTRNMDAIISGQKEDNDPIYDELEPFFAKIKEQNKQISLYLEELREERDTIEAVSKQMKEGLILIDRRKNILSVNNSAITLLNAKEGIYTGQNLMALTRNMELNIAASNAITEGEGTDFTIHTTHGNCRLMINPAYAEGEISGAILLMIDVTEQIKAEQIRREFSANVSHELKTPLTSINGFAEMIENGMASDPKDVTRFASFIHRESSRLISTINDIMRLSEIEETNQQASFEQVDLLELAHQVKETLFYIAKEKDVELILDGPGSNIEANSRMIEELIFNLTDNAIKYNRPGGQVRITIDENEAAKEATIIVADNGIGIPEEHQKRIFERFYRVDKSRSKQSGGTGLGLSIVKHIVEYHNGKIDLQSSSDTGTTITVHLPLDQNILQ